MTEIKRTLEEFMFFIKNREHENKDTLIEEFLDKEIVLQNNLKNYDVDFLIEVYKDTHFNYFQHPTDIHKLIALSMFLSLTLSEFKRCFINNNVYYIPAVQHYQSRDYYIWTDEEANIYYNIYKDNDEQGREIMSGDGYELNYKLEGIQYYMYKINE